MYSLQVRELPEKIYNKLQELAEKEHRSLSQQAIVSLAKGLEIDIDAKSKRQQNIEKLRLERDRLGKYALKNPVDLVREEREHE